MCLFSRYALSLFLSFSLSLSRSLSLSLSLYLYLSLSLYLSFSTMTISDMMLHDLGRGKVYDHLTFRLSSMHARSHTHTHTHTPPTLSFLTQYFYLPSQGIGLALVASLQRFKVHDLSFRSEEHTSE